MGRGLHVLACQAVPHHSHDSTAPTVPNATEVLYLALVQLKAKGAARKSKRFPERGIGVGGALLIHPKDIQHASTAAS
jgi:hypothetical protein